MVSSTRPTQKRSLKDRFTLLTPKQRAILHQENQNTEPVSLIIQAGGKTTNQNLKTVVFIDSTKLQLLLLRMNLEYN